MRLNLLDRKGISLPLATGLVLLLMLASASVNQLIIRTLRSIHQVEASNRAYLVAEAGVEDALYELSAHFAGYETPARETVFNSANEVDWTNRWLIQSHGLNEGCADGVNLCGSLNQSRKLNLALFNDIGDRTQTLSVPNFSITFRVPPYLIANHDTAFADGLLIDNDRDFNGDASRLNEDGAADNGACFSGPGAGTPVSGKDADCDGREDEDSLEDMVIYWKFSDGAGKTLAPQQQCLPEGSELCEKNFQRLGNDVAVTLDETMTGLREDGTEESIADFLARYDNTKTDRLQVEFLVVSPLEQVDVLSQKKIGIPAPDYELSYSADEEIPHPFFVIRSDGFYRDFKQSITTTVTPKTSIPLTDFTLIQQQ